MKRAVFLKKVAFSIFGLSVLKSCFTSPTSDGIRDFNEQEQEKQLIVRSITNNHGHSGISMTLEDVLSRTKKKYFLMGSAHSHEFLVTDFEMERLNDFQTVVFGVYTSLDHYHAFSVEIK